MGLSTTHIIIFLLIALVLFGGRGKISSLMGDFAEGIKAFKKGMQDDDKQTAQTSEPVKTIDHKPAAEVMSPSTQPESRKVG